MSEEIPVSLTRYQAYLLAGLLAKEMQRLSAFRFMRSSTGKESKQHEGLSGVFSQLPVSELINEFPEDDGP